MQQKDYKTVKKSFPSIICCLEQLFKYASLATLGYVFQEFQIIAQYIFKKSSKTLYLKHCKKKFIALLQYNACSIYKYIVDD